MITLIREKFPIFIAIIACCLLLFIGKIFYDDQFTSDSPNYNLYGE